MTLYYRNFENSSITCIISYINFRLVFMNKIPLFLIFISVISFGYSQDRNFEIKWDNSKVFSTGDNQIELPFFQKNNFNYSSESGLKFTDSWKSSENIDPDRVELTNLVTQNISTSDLKDLKLRLIPTAPKLKLYNSKTRDNAILTVEVNPIFIQNGILKKIISFNISYNA